MEPESGGRSGFSLRGSAGLIVAIAVVATLLIALPAYRWFFLISVLIGLVIAGGLAPLICFAHIQVGYPSFPARGALLNIRASPP